MEPPNIDKNPNLETLFQILAQEDPQIREKTLNVYQWGSRVYGNVTEESDWDFILIVKDPPHFELEKQKRTPKRNVDEMEKRFKVFELNRVNGMLVPISDFKAMLMEHRHEALECIYLPSKHIWKEDVKFTNVKIDFDVLRRTLGWESKRRFHGATHTAETDSFRRGKKEILHSIRYIMFAKQIVERGFIYDYACANELWKQLLAETEPKWDFYVEKYGAIRHEYSLSFASMQPLSRFYSRYDTKVAILNKLRVSCRFSRDPDSLSVATTQIVHHNGLQESDLHVVNFARAHGLTQLQKQHKLNVMRHSKHSNLVYIVGHQFEPPKTLIERECYNGILLDESKDFHLVCHSFPFIEHVGSLSQDKLSGLENLAPDWRIEEKVDGTYCCLYNYNGEWYVSTRYEPDNPEMKLSFLPIMDVARDIDVDAHFWNVWKQKGYRLPDPAWKRCYVFELIYFHHRYIVKYPEDDLIFITARDLGSNKEVPNPSALAEELGWSTPKQYDFSRLSDLNSAVSQLNPFEEKGFVLCHRVTQQRYQILAKLYVSVAYAGDLTTIGSLNLDGDIDYVHMFDICKNGYADKLTLYWPEWKHYAEVVGEPFDLFCQEVDMIYDEIKDLDDTQFALKGKISFVSSFLFRLRQHAYSNAREYLGLMAAHHRSFAKHWKEFQARLKKKDGLLILNSSKGDT